MRTSVSMLGQLLGQFLLHEKKETLFLEWLMMNFKINKRCAKSCFNCLHD
jgi:hypothetical protein